MSVPVSSHFFFSVRCRSFPVWDRRYASRSLTLEREPACAPELSLCVCVCVWGEMCDFPLSHRVRACASGAWISRPIWCSRSLWRLPALVPCDWEEFGGFVSCGPTAGDDCVTRHCCPTSFKDVFAPIWHAKRICWFKGVTADFCFLKATEIHVMASIVLENV